MKQVMQQYGAVIMAIIMFMGIMAAFYGVSIGNRQGMPAILGTILGNGVTNSSLQEKTGGAFGEFENGAIPVISVKNAYAATAGNWFLVEDWLEAKDAKGIFLPVTAKECKSESFTTADAQIAEDGKSLCISKAGIYWVSAEATDGEGRRCSVIVKLFVNAG